MSVYGAPTEFDDANNVTKTENFDWTFDYEVTSVEKDVQIATDAQYLTEFDVANLCQKPEEAEPDEAEPRAPPPTN